MITTIVEDIFNQLVDQCPDYKKISNSSIDEFMLQILKDILRNIYRGPNNLIDFDMKYCKCKTLEDCKKCCWNHEDSEEYICEECKYVDNPRYYIIFKLPIVDEIIVRYKNIKYGIIPEYLNYEKEISLDTRYLNRSENYAKHEIYILLEKIFIITGLTSYTEELYITLNDVEIESNTMKERIFQFKGQSMCNKSLKELLDGAKYTYDVYFTKNQINNYKLKHVDFINRLYIYNTNTICDNEIIYSYIETKIPSIRDDIKTYNKFGSCNSIHYINIFSNDPYFQKHTSFYETFFGDGVIYMYIRRQDWYMDNEINYPDVFKTLIVFMNVVCNILLLRYNKIDHIDKVFNNILKMMTNLSDPSYYYQLSSKNLIKYCYCIEPRKFNYNLLDEYDDDNMCIGTKDNLTRYIILNQYKISQDIDSIYKNFGCDEECRRSHDSHSEVIKNMIDKLIDDKFNNCLNDISKKMLEDSIKKHLKERLADIEKTIIVHRGIINSLDSEVCVHMLLCKLSLIVIILLIVIIIFLVIF